MNFNISFHKSHSVSFNILLNKNERILTLNFKTENVRYLKLTIKAILSNAKLCDVNVYYFSFSKFLEGHKSFLW